MDISRLYRMAGAAAVLTALAAGGLHGELLVADQFNTEKYTVGECLKDLAPGNSTGFTSKTWGNNNSTGVFYVNDGLELPAGFKWKAAGNAIGVGKFNNEVKEMREISRVTDLKTDSTSEGVIPKQGTIYLRFVCAISDSAEKYLNQKNYELLGLLPNEHSNSAKITAPSEGGLQFGFCKFANGDRKTTLAVLKQGGSEADKSPLKLVDPVEPGKTYIVVAKIELDGKGGAKVYAFASTIGDSRLRMMKLPEEPFEVNVSKMDALRHLVLSGLIMTGYEYDSNGRWESSRWASFDELAIGTELEDVFAFEETGEPVVAAGEATDIGLEGFTAHGTLSVLGAGSPVLYLDVSSDGGQTYEAHEIGTYSEAGDVDATAENLLSGATYLWRLRAKAIDGAEGVSNWQSVTLAGAPVFGETSVSLEGNAATISAHLAVPGLENGETTVELWFAEGAGELAKKKTFEAVTEAANFEGTVEDLTWGETCRYAFRATVPYNGSVLEAWTETREFAVVGNISWTNDGGTGYWGNEQNWSPNVVPTLVLPALFEAVGGRVSGYEDSAAASVYVDTKEEETVFDFADRWMLWTQSFLVGNKNAGSAARLEHGSYDLGAVAVPGEVLHADSKLVVGERATLSATSLDVGYAASGATSDSSASGNAVEIAKGATANIDGLVHLLAGRGSSVSVASGAKLSAKGIRLDAVGAKFEVDGGEVENDGPLHVFRLKNHGTVSDPSVFELRGGAKGTFKGTVYIGAGRNNSNGVTHGEIRVLDGAVFDASGQSIRIDEGNSSEGPNDDTGDSACIVVENATLKADSIAVCNDNRHNNDYLLVHEDDGKEARVVTSGNLRVAAADGNRSGKVNYDHHLRVESGEVSVGGTLYVGDNGQYYAQHTDNRVEIAGENPRVTAKSMNLYGKSRIDFELPAGGYRKTPLVVTGTAAFGDVPAVEKDNAEWKPVNEIRVDASKFIGKQTLIHAGKIEGLTEKQVTVETNPNYKVEVSVTDTDVTVEVKAPGIFIIIR
ncbi:MAG: hypothetical protein IJ802_02340 [Kiritimatiellae bacterium]|nr:hypothetical protein [Kiritimatiellia bacterium]